MSDHTTLEGAATTGWPEAGPRILLYSHDSYGLGHFRRSSSIAHAIADLCPEASLLCVTGSPRADLFPLPQGADYVKLPSVTKSSSGEYVARTLDHGFDAVVRLRAQTIAAVTRSYRPDVILVDHTPLGLGSELVPMLKEQRRRADEVHITLGLRDILDEPRRATIELGQPATRDAMAAYYDTILVYGHQEVCDLADEYGLSSFLAERLRYVGIACCVEGMMGMPAIPQAGPAHEPPHVVVTVGGGADGCRVVEPTIDALVSWDDRSPMRATIVTGPLLDEAESARIQGRVRSHRNIRFLETVPNVHELLSDADLVITMGGYNSIYEALCMRRRILALPRTHPRKEQLDRVLRLERLGLLDFVDDDAATDPSAFRARMRAALDRPAPDARAAGLRFDGATRAAEHVLTSARSLKLDLDDDGSRFRERSA